ncbi:uncharacterized protein LOC131954541 [Physella acuta]|uniref:uncharacterized protein LOC131954541 n=1 Tax=Physella acuta TaxID=109671 RepID=UPI0027DC6B6C|nr:uncharacterized protein LOC131954541 [Physella acuta]
MTWKTFVFLIATVCYAKNRLQIKPVPVSDTGLPVKVKSIQYVLFGPNPQLFDQLIELTFLSINPKPVATLSYYDYLQHKAEKTINLELIESQRTPYTYEYIENFKNYDHFVLDIAGSIPFEFVAVTSCGITPYDSVRPAIIDAWSKEYYVPGGRFVPKDVTLMNRKHLGHPIISYHLTSNDYFSVMMLGVDKQKKYMAEFVSTHVNGKMYDVVRLLSATTIQDYVFISTVDNNTLVVEKHEDPVQEQVTLSKGDLYHVG